MASLFDNLQAQAFRADIKRGTKSSIAWCRKKVADMTKISRTKLLNDEAVKQVSTPLVGRMFMYFYDPKYKKTLPYYDRFPLIIMVKKAPGGFYGINLHYLPPVLRAKFFDKLLDYSNNNKYNKSTRFKMSYDLLNKTSKLSAVKPCYKKYLTKHIKSRISEISASEWEIAIFLPTEQFIKKGKNSIWHYRFKNREQLDGKIKELVDSRLARKKEVAERKAKRLAPHSLKVGDILYASWGYDQTNIDWFKVDKLIGKHKVTLVPLGSKFAGETPEGYDNRVLPAEQVNRNAFIADGSKNYMVNGSNNSVTLSSYAWARPWDGQPLYETQAGYGH